ncbi:EAL domain-containing protein [Turicibacter sanguinis]|uniref:EAL domain-containing protein n=1 Tax=Turicibacter sanguinis TaxID=154288 RepID=UPI0018A9228D|nr:EAL domain-containing protein [Turicibacter sanguinis]MDB8553370.1 EAL domain-containing protein [Turicibacter sanguinis]
MGASISRKQLLSFFIQASYLLDKFYSIKESFNFDSISEDSLEKIIEVERSHQNFDYLVSLLILSEQYFVEQKEYHTAIVYLIDCLSLLEELDFNNILKVYIYLELGYIFESNQFYKEAENYYKRALEVSVEKKNPLLVTYSFEKLSQIILKSCNRKGIIRFNSLVQLYGENFVPASIVFVFDLLNLYVNQDYDKILEVLSYHQDYQDLGVNREFLMIIYVIQTQSFYKLNKFEEIKWLDFSHDSSISKHNPYLMLYDLTYQLIYKKDEIGQYIADVTQKLSENHQYYLLRVFYYYLLGEESIVKDKECYLKIYELLGQNRQILFYEEGILKTKIQNVYQTYKQYYNQLDSVKFDDKYRIVSWQQMGAHYQREYNSQTVVGFLMVDDCFCSEFSQELKESLINNLNAIIQGELTFCFHDHGLWFYFKACTGEVKLKQKLNSLLKPLYDNLQRKYTVAFCLPRFTSSDFSKTMRIVYTSFYGMVVHTELEQNYSVSFCQESSSYLALSEDIHNLLLKAYKEKNFIIDKKHFYNEGGQQLFGIEFKGILSDLNLVIDNLDGDKEVIRESLLMEVEMATLEIGCQLIKEAYQTIHSNPYLFIKLSRETLMNKLIVGRILNCLKRYNLNYNQIIISINEDVLFEQNEFLKKLINRLHELGVGVALDDYGTGSLTGSIRNLNINYLKLSPSLIQYLSSTYHYSGMMKSLISVCSNYNVKICCSDIDNKSSHDLISNFGIDVVSGSYYQRKLVV